MHGFVAGSGRGARVTDHLINPREYFLITRQYTTIITSLVNVNTCLRQQQTMGVKRAAGQQTWLISVRLYMRKNCRYLLKRETSSIY